VDQLTQRLDESLRQIEMTAEELRKTNGDVRGSFPTSSGGYRT